ncbi:glycosyltransferase [Oxalobacteraceae bacterium A2-2]
MSQQLNAALAAGNLAEAATLAFAEAGLGVLPVTELVGTAGLLGAQGKAEQAIALYRLWIERSDHPLRYAAWYNMAVLQMQNGAEREAEQGYRRALELHPNFLPAMLGLGLLQERRRQPEAALATWRAALAHLATLDPKEADSNPLQVQLLNHLARVCESQQHGAEAEQAYTRSLQLAPQQTEVAAAWIALRQRLCAWPVLDGPGHLTMPGLDQGAVPGQDRTAPPGVNPGTAPVLEHGAVPGLDQAALLALAAPHTLLQLADDPPLHLAAARRPGAHLPAGIPAMAAADGYVHRRLRIGYLYGAGGAHDMSRQAAELLRLHSRKVADAYAFCWSEPGAPGLGLGLDGLRGARGLERHVPLAGMSDLLAARAIRSHEIDILVDLHGAAPGARGAILAHRPAPVQISWPSLPASGGTPQADYLIADPHWLPPPLLPHIAEQPLYLSGSSRQPLRQRSVPAPPSRTRCGLPQTAFVYCAFSTAYSAPQFALWMRILLRVPGSVLWLLADSETQRDHLRLAALRHGVAAERLHFATVAGAAASLLGRARNADLCLDTWPANSEHAAGLLEAGLPLLTRAGASLAARTSASLLQAAGLPELVAGDAQAYEDAAVRLAQQPDELAALRAQLELRRGSGALFDAAALVRELELLYRRVARGRLEAHRPGARPAAAAGLPLASILVPATHTDGLDATLRAALAQGYARYEVVLLDASPDGCLHLAQPYLERHARLRYVRAAGLGMLDSLDHCLALSLGQYITIAAPGEIPAPQQLQRMLELVRQHPSAGLVASWRPLPGMPQPLFGADTVVAGNALAELLLSGGHPAAAALGQPGAVLLPRAALGPGFGHYRGRRYRALPLLATLLAALEDRHCIYVHDTLSSGAAPWQADPVEHGLESLQLLYAAHGGPCFQDDEPRYRQVLAARLMAYTGLLAAGHAELASRAAPRLEDIHLAIRQGYQQLLS